MDTDTISHIVAIIISIVLSAFFTMAQTAFLGAQKSRIKEEADSGDRRAVLAYKHVEAPDRLVTAMLVGDTLSNVTASVLSILLIQGFFDLHGVSLVLCVIAVAVVILIFGEIIPKKAASIEPELFVLRNVKLVNFVSVLFTPLVYLVDGIGRLIMIVFHIDAGSRKAITEEVLRDMLDISHEEGVLQNEEKLMITNVFDFGDQIARDIMIPRVDMTCVDVDCGYDELMELFRKDQYTRMPVYEEDTDNIIGIINIKDILLSGKKDEEFSVRKYMREAFYTFEQKKVSKLLNEMRKSSYNVAIVLNEYGNCVGMITMEDMLEEIVGDIRDEYDEDEEKNQTVIRISDREYLVDGSVRLNDINEMLELRLASEDYDTIGGYVTGLLSHLPDVGESVEDSGIRFTVEKANDTRVEMVRIFKLDDETQT